MSSCCSTSGSCEGINTFFTRSARSYERWFRIFGLEKIQKVLLEGIRRASPNAGRVLDIGCGVGILHITLLKEGAETATGIDISEGMIAVARRVAREQGVGDRVQYIQGDFVREAASIPDADTTVMDKVVCCYEDVMDLLDASTAKTRRVFALTHPRNRTLIRIGFRLQTFLAKIFRFQFHALWHDWEKLRHRISSAGFELTYERSSFAWTALIFRRVS
jgi:2-polyprenyl-3-methyl-5-hydroxy-6-metoxy-1,4-benzoquinol methylase